MKKLFTLAFILISTSIVFGQASITGIVSDSSAAAPNVGVVLYSLTAGSVVDTVISNDGSYAFTGLSQGDYIVVAKGNRIQYPNHIATYCGQSPHWSGALVISISDTLEHSNMDITLIQKPDWSGTSNKGYCTGKVEKGTTQRAGDPIPGVDIALEQIPGGIIKAGTETDGDGIFEVGKIPNNTAYKLLIDIPGMPLISTDTVTIMNEDSVYNLNFVLDTTVGNEGVYFVGEEVTSVYSFENKIYNQTKLFPTPTKGIVYIELVDSQMQVAVYNINGQLIFNNKIHSNKARLDLSNEPKGIYFIEIKGTFGVEKHKIILD